MTKFFQQLKEQNSDFARLSPDSLGAVRAVQGADPVQQVEQNMLQLTRAIMLS